MIFSFPMLIKEVFHHAGQRLHSVCEENFHFHLNSCLFTKHLWPYYHQTVPAMKNIFNSRRSGFRYIPYFFTPWPTKTLGKLSFFEVVWASNQLMHVHLKLFGKSNYKFLALPNGFSSMHSCRNTFLQKKYEKFFFLSSQIVNNCTKNYIFKNIPNINTIVE